MKMITTTSYDNGYAICKKCRLDITKDQVAAGYYNCSIDKDDYHVECVQKYHEGDWKVNVESVRTLDDLDVTSPACFFLRTILDLKPDAYWIGWEKKQEWDMVIINDNKITNKVEIVASQFYMENKIVVCKYDTKPESVVHTVQTVEQRENTGVAKTLADIIKFKDNSLVIEASKEYII